MLRPEHVMALGPVIHMIIRGVVLHVDRLNEDTYILALKGQYTRAGLYAAAALASALGYEVMPEWECPPDETNEGTKHWLVEKETA